MTDTINIQTVFDLLETEAILKRHLADTRNDITEACQAIALHAPGIKTSPDIIITDVFVGVDAEEMWLGIRKALRLNAQTRPQAPSPYPMSYYLKDVNPNE